MVRYLARPRPGGEWTKIPSEVSFYQAQFLYRSLQILILGFILATFCWMFPHNVWLRRALWGSAIIGLLLLCAAIGWRMYLRSRPPVSTLYETTVFNAAAVLAMALLGELIIRRLLAISFGVLVAAFLIFLAFSYERSDGQDTMPELVAVLDTNFWLATHVTTVLVGYSAGLLAGALAHAWVFAQLLPGRLRGGDTLGVLQKLMYGTICFGLLFSLIGTILGGIWANDSWGRFWAGIRKKMVP